MKGTGFSPYITKQRQWALATEGNVFGRETWPRGLRATWLSTYMYGLEAVPFRNRSFSAASSVVPPSTQKQKLEAWTKT
jgi:hypothetical protein